MLWKVCLYEPCLLDDNSLDLYGHFSLNYLDNIHIFINPRPPTPSTLVYAWCARSFA